jgi:hypothetical protein
MQGSELQRNIAKSAVTLAFRSPIDAPYRQFEDLYGQTTSQYAGSRKLAVFGPATAINQIARQLFGSNLCRCGAVLRSS